MGKNKKISLGIIIDLYNKYKDSNLDFNTINIRENLNKKDLYNSLYNRIWFDNFDIPVEDVNDLKNWLFKIKCNELSTSKVNDYKSVVDDQTEQEDFNSRSQGYSIRDLNTGKITGYQFRILVRNKDAFEGILTLEQMQTLYFLYSNQGRNFPTNKVLESFPQFTLNELKKIIKAFNITKCSEPFAPHFIESHTEEELRDLRIRYKAERSAQKAVVDESKGLQDYIKKQEIKIKELTDSLNNFKATFSGYEIPNITDSLIKSNDWKVQNKDLIIYLSDMHIGAYITKYALFYHDYSLDTIKNKLKQVVERFAGQSFDTIIICNLGDSIDGMNGQTARGTKLIQQLDGDKKMYQWFMDAMLYFFDLIDTNINYQDLRYYAVGESNHGGSFEYVCQKSLENALNLKYPLVQTKVFDEIYGMFKLNNKAWIITHGNDSSELFKGLPLTIDKNPKIENQLTQLLDNKFNVNYAHIIKGDLHQSATTFGNRFRYRSVGCMLGSNDWSGANFGDCKSMVDYDIVQNDDILEGRIYLK